MELTKHAIVPKHTKVSDKEKQDLLDTYGITLRELPRILIKDPGLGKLDVKEGDVVKVARTSPTAGESFFFRRVVAT
ncbi:MAG: DNA-directed RNA polymerase subunit RpoH/Rpb5 C-terminal domain-containing protein [Candidatus Woesearchaeota archaeon]|jgi:DNA-directed RNA polymerase subunit H (RpoH/RPB5)|nr:DNA-directed RNA polymerase subunit RpoH/Rpb5 C-terminal domain-containing protein [Candidatus Woesearchaeota archaeon]